MKKVDFTGRTFGRLEVLRLHERLQKEAYWFCKCACGTEKIVSGGSLRNGAKSCGCVRIEASRRSAVMLSKTHGKSRSPLYRVWQSMKDRCLNQNCHAYSIYGGRGITICADWLDYLEFEKWAESNGYEKGLSLDRIDNDCGYSPANCRWADHVVQCNNKSNNRTLTHHGKTMTISQWSRELGIKKATLFSRVRQGLSADEILNPLISPVNKDSYIASPEEEAA